MDRRELFGSLAAIGAGLPLPASEPDGKMEHAGGPMSGPHAHFCGIHMAKKNPKFQIITQHYCAAHTSDASGEAMFQCVLFDNTTSNAKLLGVEYIITEATYRKLPDGEKKYWHPHTYEVLGGGLIAPGMKPEDEKNFMKTILTTWGKAWHTWPDPLTPVPVGEPLLIWSLMADDQVDPSVVAKRDKQFSCSTKKIREERAKELGFAVPDVAAPRSLEDLGRQWTNSGDDKPTKK